MNQERNDKELERYLDGNSAESRRYAELGNERPPPEIDALILAQAERAVKVTELPTRRTPPFKAFAWAAIVVLSFSLVLNIVFRELPRDPMAELESMAGRSDIPTRPVEMQAPDAMFTMKKAERAESRGAAISKDALVEAPARRREPEEEMRDVPQSVAAAPPFADEITADEIMTDEIMTDEIRVYEQSVQVRQVEPKPAASTMARAGVSAPEKAQTRELVMQVVADYISPAASADRGKGLASTVPGDSKADAELSRILDRYDEGYPEEAMTALTDFRVKFPQHPVSVVLVDKGL